jgi:hypothetical protein
VKNCFNFFEYSWQQENGIISDHIIGDVANRKAAYLRDGSTIAKVMNQNPHKIVVVAKEEFSPVFNGYYINKNLNEPRIKI